MRDLFLDWRDKYEVNDFRYAFTRETKYAITEIKMSGIGK